MSSLTYTTITTAAQLQPELHALLSLNNGPTTTHAAPFVVVTAEGAGSNKLAAVSRFNPIVYMNLMSQCGSKVLRVDLHAVLKSAAAANNNGCDDGQQNQHPLAPLLRLLNSSDFVKIVADGRGVQDAIATDFAVFDAAMLNHVVDLSLLPIYFGYEDRYQPRFQRGVLRLPTVREAAAFLRAPIRPMPAALTVDGTVVEAKALRTATLSSVYTTVEYLGLLRSIADAQLRRSIVANAMTPSAAVFRAQRQQTAMAAATQLLNVLKRQQRDNNSKNGGGRNNSSSNAATAATATATATAPPNKISRSEIEAKVNECYASKAAITAADTDLLVGLALDDILAASRRLINTLGDYQHPQVIAKRQQQQQCDGTSASSSCCSVDDSDARQHLAKLLDARKGNYLPFGVIQPLTSQAEKVVNAMSNNNANNSAANASADPLQLLAKHKAQLEQCSHAHQQQVDAQRKVAALKATRANPSLSQVVSDIYGSVSTTSASASATMTMNSSINAAESGKRGKRQKNGSTAADVATVRFVEEKGSKRNGHKKQQQVASNGFLSTSDAAAVAANNNTNPNRPQDVVKHCHVCYLPFTAKVSSHEARRAKDDANAVNSASAICANCVEKALPCEFFRRGCCFRTDCDYHHALVPCPFGAQCISYAIERFTKEQSAKANANNSAVVGGGVNGVPSTPMGNNCGCCPFVHPGENGYVSATTSAGTSLSATPSAAMKFSSNPTPCSAHADPNAVSLSTTSFTVRSPNTANCDGFPAAADASISATAVGSNNNNTDSNGASLSALFQPSLVNPIGVVAPHNNTKEAIVEGEENSSNNNSAARSSTSKNNNGAAAKGSKRALCPNHFYSATGCPLGARCRLSHAPIPLYVPIPTVVAAKPTASPAAAANSAAAQQQEVVVA